MSPNKLLLITIAGLVIGCSTRREKGQVDSAISTDSVPAFQQGEQNFLELGTYLESGTAVAMDTAIFQIVDQTSAAFVYPTAEQIEKMRQLYGEENFASIVDDAMWYTSSANEILDSMKVNKVDIKKQYIIFKDTDHSWTLNIKKKGMPEWNLFFFKKGKSPEVISTADLTAEKIKEYFY